MLFREISFHDKFLPHLNAAYNLARWLMRSEQEAEDIVQEAYLRALRHIAGFRGGDGRAWLLTIVRNGCYDRLKQNGARDHSVFDEKIHSLGQESLNPDAWVLREENAEQVREALAALPMHLREVLVLRELEELSYSEIAGIARVPLGTVMSRLSRARRLLQKSFPERAQRQNSSLQPSTH